MDESEVRKLLETKNRCRIPSMLPIPDPKSHSALPFIPLPSYNQIKKQKDKEKREHLKQYLREKLPLINKSMEAEEPAEYIEQEDCISQLRLCAAKRQPHKMIDSWVSKILHNVPTKLRDAFPEYTEDLLKECEQEWNEVLTEFSISKVIRLDPEHSLRTSMTVFEPNVVSTHDLEIPKKNAVKIKMNKKKIEESSLFLHPFIRLILRSSQTMFPEVIIDLSTFRKIDFFSLETFKNMYKQELKKSDHLVSRIWYSGVLIKWLKKTRSFCNLDTFKLNKLVTCASKIISFQIQELMRRSIHAILECVGDVNQAPVLNIHLDFNGDFFYTPSLEKIQCTYLDIINNIVNIAQRLIPIEHYLKIPYKHDSLSVCYNENLLNESHEKLVVKLNIADMPLVSYLSSLRNNFSIIYGPSARETITTFIKETNDFNTIIEKIQLFRNALSDINSMLGNIYFTNAVVNQVELMKSLKNNVIQCIDVLVKGIVTSHMQENNNICSEFEIIAAKALKSPINARELVEQGTYIANVKNNKMDSLESRLLSQLNILMCLIEMTTLSVEHININTQSINWLTNISEIFQKNALAFESSKAEMEENLMTKINELSEVVKEITPHLEMLDLMDDINNTLEYLEYLRKLVLRIKDCEKLITWINDEETTFKFPTSVYPEFEEIKDMLLPFYSLVYLVRKWRRNFFKWMDGTFEYLDSKEIESDYNFYHSEFTKLFKDYKNKIKSQIADGVARRFGGLVDDSDINKLPAPMKLCAQAIAEIKDWQPNIRLTHIVCNKALCQRHWDEMSVISGLDLTPNAGTSLRKIIQMDLWDYMDQFEVISIAAEKQLALVTSLEKMISEWDTLCLTKSFYKDSNIIILTCTDDVRDIINEHTVKTIAMRGSAFVKPFENQVHDWYSKITKINEMLDLWNEVQSQWLYLRPFFMSQGKPEKLTDEYLFYELEKICLDIVHFLTKDLKLVRVMDKNVTKLLETVTELIDKINNAVNLNLETKRLEFPRLFFLSNNETYEILTNIKTPKLIQNHVNKCFTGINSLIFDNEQNITAFCSSEGETIEFPEKIRVTESNGSVLRWLIETENKMLIAVKSEMELSFSDYNNSERINWMLKWSEMVILTISQIYWTINVHNCLQHQNSKELRNIFTNLTQTLSQSVQIIRATSIAKHQAAAIRALILQDVHAKDVILELLQKNVEDCNDFQWSGQLRYYWENNRILVKMFNVQSNYAYEYQGNSSKLVITPLTERCYRSLIYSYNLHLGGILDGISGTGKTDTIKSLANALATYCVVFHCCEGIDYKTISRILKGSICCGAWVCFDDFDRIKVDVLSVIAQQILCITQASSQNQSCITFEGSSLNVNKSLYISAILNSRDISRTKLPDNLKVLFRTAAMTSPDCATIGYICLYSFGFQDAQNLSNKIVLTCELTSDLLSQRHFSNSNVRFVKIIILEAAKLKRKFPNEAEDVLILNSLKKVFLSRLSSNDIPLFDKIIQDIFPKMILPETNHDDLLKACYESCLSQNLQPSKHILQKVIQIYEVMTIWRGLMLVGESCSGKSSAIKILSNSLTLMNKNLQIPQVCNYQVLNPKAVTERQLFGYLDPLSNKWFDGLVKTIFRKLTEDKSNDINWIVFDGPVDILLLENMNYVLDKTKTMCLTSGEVISIDVNISIIFEVTDLLQTTPAFISRCGIVNMNSDSVDYTSIVQSWMTNLNTCWLKDNSEFIMTMCNWLFIPLISYVQECCTELITTGSTNLVVNTLTLLTMLMDNALEVEDDGKNLKTWITVSFITALVWGVGGTLDLQSREKFDFLVKDYFKTEKNLPATLDRLEISFPSEGLLIDHFYIYKGKGSWKHWNDHVKAIQVTEHSNVFQTLVPTIDTEKYIFLLDMHTKFVKPLMFIGPSGTGKSFCVTTYFANNINNQLSSNLIKLTSTTTANQTHSLITSKLTRIKRNNYGPCKGKQAIIFIDDINSPIKDKHGTQPALELLRFLLDQKYLYDLKTADKIRFYDILFFGALDAVRGSRQQVSPRLLKHFSIYSINEFDKDAMTKIFTTLLQFSWKRNGFGQEVNPIISNIVAATLEIYLNVLEMYKPSNGKTHYMFNLRDILKVIQGCVLLKKESTDNRKIFNKLWVHEILRVFYDGLVDEEDRLQFFGLLEETSNNIFKESMEFILENCLDEDKKVSRESLKKLMFGCYIDSQLSEEEKKYEEILSKETLYNIASSALLHYNSTNKIKLDVILFNNALDYLSKICRLLSIPSGNGLLVGVNGVGRRSLTQLASCIFGHETFQPVLSKLYDSKQWYKDIKVVLKKAGGYNKSITFLATEDQLKNESLIVDLISLLNSGEIPNVYNLEESEEILELVRLDAQSGNRNLDISPVAVMEFFISRCRKKIHTMLCINWYNEFYRTKLKQFPDFLNYCTVIWFDNWPQDALSAVAHYNVENFITSNKYKHAVSIVCQKFYYDARFICKDYFYQKTDKNTYVTPSSFLHFIKLLHYLKSKKEEEIKFDLKRYISGLNKLNEAEETITKMQCELNALKPQLEDMAKISTTMMKEIKSEKAIADKASAQIKTDQISANIQAAAAADLKKDCEADLALALPILEDAISALNTLKPADITIVKSMKNPPATVKLVMASVCVMKGIPADRIPDPNNPGRKIMDFWGPSKRILGDMGFLESLKSFDKDDIPTSIIAKIRKDYISHKDFKPHIIAKASNAAEGLCKWIIAMDMYEAVSKIVAPKKAKLETAEIEYAETLGILNDKKAKVAQLEQKLINLNKELKDANIKKKLLGEEVKSCSQKLQRAEMLLNGLGGEKDRWSKSAEVLRQRLNNLLGDCLISCGIIVYLTPYFVDVRENYTKNWCYFIDQLNIPRSNQFSLKSVLGNEIKIHNWCIQGLPVDQFSVDNAVILDNSMRWTLLVDPQGQATKWIVNMEKPNDLRILKLTDSDCMQILRSSIECGKPVLIESITGDLDPYFDPILLKQFYKNDDKDYITINNITIEYNPNFKFYMTSSIKNPCFSVETYNKITIINFALTMEGLKDQLLGIVISKEKADIQSKHNYLLAQEALHKTDLKEVENSILKILQETSDILEDETAIKIINTSKRSALNIIQKQNSNIKAETSIENYRENFKEFVEFAAVLFNCVKDLSNVDPMYQYSLQWFINIFKVSIEHAPKSNDLEKRLSFLKESFAYALYLKVCRTLFEKDKVMFAFAMCINIMTINKEINVEEYLFYISPNNETKKPIDNNPIKWLPNKIWAEICRLEKLTAFQNIKANLVEFESEWKVIYEAWDPDFTLLPGHWALPLTSFEKLSIMKVLRPDCILKAVSEFIVKQMGQKFIEPPQYDLQKSYRESNCLTPLILILSPGIAPINMLTSLCKSNGNKLFFISMGQDQETRAEIMIKSAQREGTWICIQNCHLAIPWLPRLEKIVAEIKLSSTDFNFRLWLTTYSIKQFPQSILETGIKVTIESPCGLKNNILSIFQSDPLKRSDYFEGCPGKDKVFSKLVYGIVFFHVVVQERKKYGSLGWNMPYDFSDSDMHISLTQLQLFVNQYEILQYDTLKYLISECNYGGKVANEWDRRLITTLIDIYINQEVVQNPNYYFSDTGLEYGLPRRCEYRNYLQHIRLLPQNPSAEVYGLHRNCEILKDYTASQEIIKSILLLEGNEDKLFNINNIQNNVLEQAKDIIDKLFPHNFDLKEVKTKYLASNDAFKSVLVLEMEQFNLLTNTIRTSLLNIQQAIEGLIVMTPDLERQYTAISKSKIPKSWRKVSYLQSNNMLLPRFIADLLQRLKSLEQWNLNGEMSTFWLSGMFSPQALLIASKQNFSRSKLIPMDLLVYDFDVRDLDFEKESPTVGVYVNGLFMEGGRWDRKTRFIQEQHPRICNEAMPVIWIYPKLKSEFEEGMRYRCPLYKTSERKSETFNLGLFSNFVQAIYLPSNKPTHHWVLRGVALLQQLDN